MKKVFNYIFFLISTIAIHGQVNLEVIPDTKDLRTDQQLVLTIRLEIKGDEYAQQSPLQLMDTSQFNIIGSASKQNTDINAQTQKVINQLVYQIVLQPKRTGKIKIGSALVTVNNKIYKTEPFDVFVSKGNTKALAKTDDENDIFLNLEIKNKNIYKNQLTLAVLKVYSRNIDNFRNLSHIRIPQNGNVNFQQIDFKKSDIEQDGELASQTIGVFLISAKESGIIKIPAVSAVLKNKKISSTLQSKNVNLNVKQLPENEPLNYKNAVGDFKVNLSSNIKNINPVGEPVNVEIKISGAGNFKTMALPKLKKSSDYIFFPPKTIYTTKSSTNGFVGNVILKYVVIPKKSGKIVLKSEPFSFFDPTENIFKDLKSDTLSIKTLTAEEISDTQSTLDKMNEYTSNVLQKSVDAPKMIADHLNKEKSNSTLYKIIIGNLVLIFGLAFFFFRYKKREKEKNILKEKSVLPAIENVSEAENRLKQEKSLDLEVEIAYLAKLNNSKNFDDFFKNYESLLLDLEQFSQNKGFTSFSNFLEEKNGAAQAKEFINLTAEFALEKYTPFRSEENINNLFLKFRKTLSEIIK